MQRTIIAFVVVGVLALVALYAGKGRLTGQGAGRESPIIATESVAEAIHDVRELRCDAYFELANCDLRECTARNLEKNAGDQTRIDSGQERCDARIKRKLKRPNRKYDCGFNTCDIGFFERRASRIQMKYLVCQAHNEVEDLGEEHMIKCSRDCGSALVALYSLADQNYCEELTLPSDCDSF